MIATSSAAGDAAPERRTPRTRLPRWWHGLPSGCGRRGGVSGVGGCWAGGTPGTPRAPGCWLGAQIPGRRCLPGGSRGRTVWEDHHVTAPLEESLFLKACRREPVPATPVWFMRQAGRSLPEYRAVRDRLSMVKACTTADVITELTLQPLRRFAVDAAILFSDIVVPLRAVGLASATKRGGGPVTGKPFRGEKDLPRLRGLEPGDVPYITDAVRMLVAELGATPLIGFAGAPFTLASYLIEGGPSKNHERTRALMYGNPATWHALLRRLADITAAFLRVQVDAGAAAVQLFDSWVGVLSPDDYLSAVLPHTQRVFHAMAGLGVPRIHFGVGTGELLRLMGEAGADVVGVDWRVGLDEAARRVDAGK